MCHGCVLLWHKVLDDELLQWMIRDLRLQLQTVLLKIAIGIAIRSSILFAHAVSPSQHPSFPRHD